MFYISILLLGYVRNLGYAFGLTAATKPLSEQFGKKEDFLSWSEYSISKKGGGAGCQINKCCSAPLILAGGPPGSAKCPRGFSPGFSF